MRLKSLVPVLLLGAVLAGIVFTARFTQRYLHEREMQDATAPAPAATPAAPRVEAPPPDPNSVKDEQDEAARLAQAFPDWTPWQRGMRYRIIRAGAGPKPVTGSLVTAHYRGRLLDGTVFDTSYAAGQPLRFRLNRGNVILGWDLTLLDMQAGEVREVAIPYRLAYGESGKPPKIPPRAPLIFEIELVQFE